MKLKGKVLENLSDDKKEKMQETLNRMEETRVEDGKTLRTKMKAKLDWAISEQKKGLDIIEQNKIQVQRLQGIILVLAELLEKPKDDNNKDTV